MNEIKKANKTDRVEACLICGKPLRYYTETKFMTCSLCGNKFASNAECEDGHYICDGCHFGNSIEVAIARCLFIDSSDPIEIMNMLMSDESVHMHGPEHHVLVGLALITAYKNAGGQLNLSEALKKMKERGSQVPGGVCGFWGCCGAAISSGIYMSIVTGSTPMSKESWGASNLMTSESLKKIGAVGGPRCCKRDSFLSIEAAVKFTDEHLSVKMDLSDNISCNFASKNAQCIGSRCPFNRKDEPEK